MVIPSRCFKGWAFKWFNPDGSELSPERVSAITDTVEVVEDYILVYNKLLVQSATTIGLGVLAVVGLASVSYSIYKKIKKTNKEIEELNGNLQSKIKETINKFGEEK